MLINILILFYVIRSALTATSIKTYPTIDLKENVPLNTNVLDLRSNVTDKLKLVLLNLGGYETNLFTIKNESIYTINEIDREQFLAEKRCFDRSYCLIEVHVLVNDGEQYWVVPIHIVDENDNKPEFKESSIELKFREDISGGYQIPFEGAKDLDEGLNGRIRYKLDYSNPNENEILLLFELIILSRSLINQYDQLALKIVPSSLINNREMKNEYKLILYATDSAEFGKQLTTSMNINIKIERMLKEPKFLLSEYNFIIQINFPLKNGTILGNVKAQTNDQSKLILYKIKNRNDFIEINSLTGDLFIKNVNICSYNNNKNPIELFVESSYLNNNYSNLKSLTKVKFYFRLLNYINNISYEFQFNSFNIEQIKNSNEFFISKNLSENQVLFNLSILSQYYPVDQYILSLENYHSTFSLIPSSLSKNNYLLKTNKDLKLNSVYLLTIRLKHQLTDQWLTKDLIIKLSLIDKLSSSLICLENSTYFLYDFNQKNLIGKLRVIQTNSNISSFSNFSILFNQNQFLIDECQMFIEQFDDLYSNQSDYQLCSTNHSCYNITLTNSFMSSSKSLLSIRPIEITIFIFGVIFIMASITLILIICRLKGFRLCLTIKNYLFYGKKYGLSNAQRLSLTKKTQRVHSIVVRESRSPSIEIIKPKPYVYNIEQETYLQSLSYTSSLQREEKTLSNVDNHTVSSKSLLQENKQLLDFISSNQDLDVSRLASEV